MKDLTDEFKLNARSTAEVFVILGQMVDRVKADRRLRFRDKKPTRAAIVNAALLYLDTLPTTEVERALGIGLGRLEGFLAGGETSVVAAPPVEAAAVAPAGPPPPPLSPKRRVNLKVEDVSPEAPPAQPASRRKRGG